MVIPLDDSAYKKMNSLLNTDSNDTQHAIFNANNELFTPSGWNKGTGPASYYIKNCAFVFIKRLTLIDVEVAITQSKDVSNGMVTCKLNPLFMPLFGYHAQMLYKMKTKRETININIYLTIRVTNLPHEG